MAAGPAGTACSGIWSIAILRHRHSVVWHLRSRQVVSLGTSFGDAVDALDALISAPLADRTLFGALDFGGGTVVTTGTSVFRLAVSHIGGKRDNWKRMHNEWMNRSHVVKTN